MQMQANDFELNPDPPLKIIIWQVCIDQYSKLQFSVHHFFVFVDPKDNSQKTAQLWSKNCRLEYYNETHELSHTYMIAVIYTLDLRVNQFKKKKRNDW